MNFATLALICAVAILGPVMSLQRWSLPVVLGELLVGLVLGATGLGVLHADDPTFTFLAQIGFALVMFVTGTHIPLRSPDLRAGLSQGILRALAIGALAVPAGLGIAALFGTGHGWLYAVLIASSSAALVMPALAGLPLTAPSIVAMLPQIAIADTACIVLLPLAIDPANATRAGLGAAAVLAAGVPVYLFLRRAQRSGARRRMHDVSEDRGLALELRVTLTLLFGLAALAVFVHVSIMLAGFVLGLIVAAVGEPHRLAHQAFALTEGFFGPVFFVWLGASLDLTKVVERPEALALGLVLGAGAAVVHASMALTGQPLPVAAATAGQLGVPVAAATLGTTLGLLGPGEDAALLLGALVTIAVLAVVNRSLVRIAGAGPAPP
ncbi:cation:proton antiporter [Arthrobacter ginkgonis]|uniref:Cation:proton antiporter n=1 Tax=Arthrobacter ginkgonis TaxID=1630594 RepID=A0ABP7CCS6_9MICC